MTTISMTEIPAFWIAAALLPFAASLAGFMAGLLGIGGGIILVPCLYYILSVAGFPDEHLMHMAVGTSLAAMIPTGLSSVRAHRRRRAVEGALFRAIGAGVLAGSLGGAAVAGYLSAAALKTVFAVALLFLSLIMGLGEKISFRGGLPSQPWKALAGLFIGALSAIMGIGGATMSVPYMTLHGVPMHKAVGTASALGLLISIPAAMIFIVTGLDQAGRPPLSIGYMNIAAWIVILPFSIFVPPLGARAAHALPVRPLRLTFSAVMALIALRMILGS